MTFSEQHPVENRLALRISEFCVASATDSMNSFIRDTISSSKLSVSNEAFRDETVLVLDKLNDELRASLTSTKDIASVFIGRELSFESDSLDITYLLQDYLITKQKDYLVSEASAFKTIDDLEYAIEEELFINVILYSQRIFYAHFFGDKLIDGLLIPMKILFLKDFIQDKFQENNDLNIEQPNTTKLKTNLSVPELAYLFKMLNELKPNIFDVKSNAELYRFISSNFESKRSEVISTDRLNNLNSTPDPKAIGFWKKHLSTLYTEIKKL